MAPGPFWTPLQVSGGDSITREVSSGESVPMGRSGQPVALAPVYVLPGSSQASYITGQIYGATGGNSKS